MNVDCRRCETNGQCPFDTPGEFLEFMGEEIEGCPWLYVEPASRFWLELFPFFQDHVLLETGGLADQPIRYFSAMKIIGEELRKYESEKKEDLEKKRLRNAR